MSNKKFINQPDNRNAGAVLYNSARQELIKNFGTKNDVAAMYDYGSINHPGISDLDIFLVFKSDLTNSDYSDYQIKPDKFPILTYLPRGTLMIADKQSFESIHWLDEDIKIKNFFGEDINLEKLNPLMEKQRAIASIIDWLPERVGQLLKIYRKEEIDITFLLRVLKSFSYTTDKLAVMLQDDRYRNFGIMINQLRAEWKIGKEGDLVKLLEFGLRLGFDAIRTFGKTFLANEQLHSGWLLLFNDLRFVFAQNEDMINLDTALRLSENGTNVVPLPGSYAPHFSFYSKQKGILAEQMRIQSQLPDVLPSSEIYREYLAKKMATATSCANFLIKNRFSDGLFRFGFYFQNYLRRMKL